MLDNHRLNYGDKKYELMFLTKESLSDSYKNPTLKQSLTINVRSRQDDKKPEIIKSV